MQTKKLGRQSVQFAQPPAIIATATTVGPKEGEGPLAVYFDKIMPDTINGQDSWEKAEAVMLRDTILQSVKKAKLELKQIDFLLAGDLLNQLIAANFAIREIGLPFFGLYGACSTMAESLALGAMIIDGGFAGHVVAAASSHHDTAERQYRFPTELGIQRPPTSQWTVTGAGAAVLGRQQPGPQVTMITVGKVVDMGVKDVNNMGAAMAPAAADTLWQHFEDTGRTPAYYDLILTGDLGSVGKDLVTELLLQKGLEITANYDDCGLLIYRPDQDVHAGASGCASSAVVFCGYIYREMQRGRFRRILLAGTGALHSPTSYQQKESIPAIAHAVAVEVA